MSRIRTLFLGTPEFAAKILSALVTDEHLEIVGVVTQPDKPRGRHLKVLPSPVKERANILNLPCVTPEKIRSQHDWHLIQQFSAELAIVVAYGQILPEDFLKLFHYGIVNIHGSLLPKWRGAAPIQRSLEAGEKVTGVTLQKISPELDAGDIIGYRTLNVTDDMDALDVLKALEPLSIDLLTVDLIDYVRGNLAPIPQDHSQATYAPKITKEECLIDWNLPAPVIHNKIRAFVLGPGAYSTLGNHRLKILKSKLPEPHYPMPSALANLPPGTLLEKNRQIWVTCASGSFLELVTVLPENRSPQKAYDWWQGLHQKNLSFVTSVQGTKT
ncbi:MAG: methionyl-tRNA formyltransferase [Pseudobdellovibrionaceae bacterium]|nr:methionyl-tRNA formyltransferase [Pseudobdellovibrionaceae bacterium]